MTELTKPITRLTELEHDGAKLAVTIDPGEGDPLVVFHAKRRKWQFKVAISKVLELAIAETGRLSDEEIAVMSKSKTSIEANPRLGPVQKRAICEAINSDISAEILLRHEQVPVLDDTDSNPPGDGKHVDDN